LDEQLARLALYRTPVTTKEEALCERVTDLVDTIIEMEAMADELYDY